jgi:hypothetical protein
VNSCREEFSWIQKEKRSIKSFIYLWSKLKEKPSNPSNPVGNSSAFIQKDKR